MNETLVEAEKGWYELRVNRCELDVDLTLSSGQIFSWHRHHVPGPEGGHQEWRGIIQDRLAAVAS